MFIQGFFCYIYSVNKIYINIVEWMWAIIIQDTEEIYGMLWSKGNRPPSRS